MRKVKIMIVMALICMLFAGCGNDKNNGDNNGNVNDVTSYEGTIAEEVVTTTESVAAPTVADPTVKPADKPIELPFVPVN